MLRLKKIAVTGGPASGKSSVCHFLKELGAYVISADEVVHQLLSQDQKIRGKLIEILGEGILDAHHQIDRSKIAKFIFNNIGQLQAVEKIIHPQVRKAVSEQYETVSKKRPLPSLFVVEIPLLYESNMEEDFDKVIAVTAEKDVCRKRYKGNDYDERANRFLPDTKRMKKAEITIPNMGTLEELREKTIKAFRQIYYQ